MSKSLNGGRERAYRALRDSEELHRATLNAISDAVFLTDGEGRFTYICPNVNVIFGYVPDEVQALGRIDALLGEDLFDRDRLLSVGEFTNIEREVRTKSGEQRRLLIIVKAVSIQGSAVLYACRDITERSRAKEELRLARLELLHASRVALAGQLMASITHEVNQPLAAIVSNADAGLLLTGEESTDGGNGELHAILADIHAEGERAADIIRRLRNLVRKQPLKRESLDLSRLADGTLELVRGEVDRHRVSLRAELAPSLPAIHGDRVSLQQVLLNLLLNAIEAMDTVEEADRRLIVRTAEIGDGVEVAVSDHGPGIPPGRKEKVFDPFFTTKEEGIGLGLVIAQSIIDAHGGRIWASDHGRRGATFHVQLPLQGS